MSIWWPRRLGLAMMTYQWLICFRLWLSETGTCLWWVSVCHSAEPPGSQEKCILPKFGKGLCATLVPVAQTSFHSLHSISSCSIVDRLEGGISGNFELFPFNLKNIHMHANTYMPESQERLKRPLWSMSGLGIATVALASKESTNLYARTKAQNTKSFLPPCRSETGQWTSWMPILSSDLKPATQTPKLHSWKQVCFPRISAYSIFKMSKFIISSVSENPAFFSKMPALQGRQELQSKHILVLPSPPLGIRQPSPTA